MKTHLLLEHTELLRQLCSFRFQFGALLLWAAALPGHVFQLKEAETWTLKAERRRWFLRRTTAAKLGVLTLCSVWRSLSESSLTWLSFWLSVSLRLPMSSSFSDVSASEFSFSRRELSRLSWLSVSLRRNKKSISHGYWFCLVGLQDCITSPPLLVAAHCRSCSSSSLIKAAAGRLRAANGAHSLTNWSGYIGFKSVIISHFLGASRLVY